MAKFNKSNFDLKNMTKVFDSLLTKYDVYNKIQPKFQQLQLPKLKTIDLPKLKKMELPKLKAVQ